MTEQTGIAEYLTEEDESPLDDIIRHFNERWFSAWDATPEEQRVKLIAIADSVRESAVYKEQVEGNADEQNRKLAQESIIGEIVRKQRRKDMSLYKNYAEDPDFRKSVEESIIRILALHDKSWPGINGVMLTDSQSCVLAGVLHFRQR